MHQERGPPHRSLGKRREYQYFTFSLRTKAESQRTKEQSQWLVRPPGEQDEERHPEERELDTQVDRAPLGERRRCLGLQEERSANEVQDCDHTVG